MDFYSASLAVGLGTVSASLALAAVALLPAVARSRASPMRRLGRVTCVIAFIALSISALSHVAWGHRPGSARALGPAEFLREHPALGIGAGLAVFAWLLLRRRRAEDPEGSSRADL